MKAKKFYFFRYWRYIRDGRFHVEELIRSLEGEGGGIEILHKSFIANRHICENKWRAFFPIPGWNHEEARG